MYDIRLDKNGDIDVSEFGDIFLTESVTQNIKIRLRWIHDEWRLGTELGFPWFEDVFVKNPNVDRIKMLIRNEISKVDGVENVRVTNAEFDIKNRTAKFYFSYSVGEETYKEEVMLHG